MDETDENLSADDASIVDGLSSVRVKPKKRSLVERELETSLTARVTSPVMNSDTSSTSRYGRARRLKTDPDYDSEKAMKQMKSPVSIIDKTPVKMQSPVYKMHASNSPIKTEPKETPKKVITTESNLENQIENIYHENISLSRFGSDEKNNKSPGAKFPKVYVRKDLIQKREKEDTVVLIKNMFSPIKSPYKSTNSHLNNILERSSEKYHLNSATKSQNGYLNTSSVVKTLDFDNNKKKKNKNGDNKVVLSKSDLFEMEAKCEYQVGDLAWARMGTYPFWPCIVTREPSTGMFVKKKLFGRVERDVIHVTFFGDNGRRGWIVDTMLRKFLGQLEFEATRERFSPTAKKRDPRLFAAYFISEKKMPQWMLSVEEAETLLREPKRLRIDILNEMLVKSRLNKSVTKSQKGGKITRTASDVSLSESLYDTLFSEDDGKAEDSEKSRSKNRASLDVSEVVTACLDNMAAKTGITKIQRQSHMDRWLQKAKSKTPEKLQSKITSYMKEKEVKVISSKTKKRVSPTVPKTKPYSFRKSVCESQNLKPHHNEHDYSTKLNDTMQNDNETSVIKVESLSSKESVEDEVSQLATENNEPMNESKSFVECDSNTTIPGIVSTDQTMDEIQVNICSVEENAELEKCIVEHSKTQENTTEVIVKIEANQHDENMPVDSENNLDSNKNKETDNEKHKKNVEVEVDIAEKLHSMQNRVEQIGQKESDSETKTGNVNVVIAVNHPRTSKRLRERLENRHAKSDSHIQNIKVESPNISQEILPNVLDTNTKVDSNERVTSSDSVQLKDVKLIEIKVRLEKDVQIVNKKGPMVSPESDKPSKTDPVIKEDVKQFNFEKPVLRRRVNRYTENKRTEDVIDAHNVQNNVDKTIVTRNKSSRKQSKTKNDYIQERSVESTIESKEVDQSLEIVPDYVKTDHMQVNDKSLIEAQSLKPTEDVNGVESLHLPTKIPTLDQSLNSLQEDKKECIQIDSDSSMKEKSMENVQKDQDDKNEGIQVDTGTSMMDHSLEPVQEHDKSGSILVDSETPMKDQFVDQVLEDNKKECMEVDAQTPINENYVVNVQQNDTNENVHLVTENFTKQQAPVKEEHETENILAGSHKDIKEKRDLELDNESPIIDKSLISADKKERIQVEPNNQCEKANTVECIESTDYLVDVKANPVESIKSSDDSVNIQISDKSLVTKEYEPTVTVSQIDQPDTEADNESNSNISAENEEVSQKRNYFEKSPKVPITSDLKPAGTNNDVPEEDIEYGHLEFTEKTITPEKLLAKKTQITPVKFNQAFNGECDDKEYDHLDFIFSSIGGNDLKHSSRNHVEKNNLFQHENGSKVSSNETEKVNSEYSSKSQPKLVVKVGDQTEKTANLPCAKNNLIKTIKIIDSDQHELRVSIEKMPLNSFPISELTSISVSKIDKENSYRNDDKSHSVMNNADISIDDEDKLLNSEDDSTLPNNGVYCEDDEDLDERLLLQEDSFENRNSLGDSDKTKTCETSNENNINVNKNTSEMVQGDRLSNNRDHRDNIMDTVLSNECINDNASNENIANSTIENGTLADTNVLDDCETVSQGDVTDKLEKCTENAGTVIDVDMFVTSVNRLPEPVKLNGFHVDECLDLSDGEFNVETSSINSEDSEPLSVTKTKLLSQNRKEANKALENAEFVKYLEMRQDQLMDEHPELSQEEIIEYLYKTWEYEENAKPDLVKNDDIEQSGLVKGLDTNLKPKRSKKRNKKRDEDTLSINSDISDTSSRRRLRTRIAKSPATSIEDCETSLPKEMSLEIKSELLDNISINSDISCNSLKYIPFDNKPSEILSSPLSRHNLSPVSKISVELESASTENTLDKSEDSKHSNTKEKVKSPKNKDVSIKSYFKSSESKSKNNDNQVCEETLKNIKEEYDPDTASINSEDSEVSQTRKRRKQTEKNKSMTDPEFLKYVELRQDHLIDENPQLTQEEIMSYLYKTWLYEESGKSDLKKSDDLEQASLVKGLNQAPSTPQQKRVKKRVKLEKDYILGDEIQPRKKIKVEIDEDIQPKDKPKRKISQPYYNEDLSDMEDDIELFEIFKPKKKLNLLNTSDGRVKTEDSQPIIDEDVIEIDEVDEVELYFSQLTQPKPNVFKGLVREKVCEICEKTGNLVKCKGCNCMFHDECVKKQNEVVEVPEPPTRGRRKKIKKVGRKPKNLEDSESHSDEKSQDVSEELNVSMEEDLESRTVNAEDFETVLKAKMQELLPTVDANYDSYSSDDGLDWNSAPPGKCEIVDVKLKPKIVVDYSNFKCNKCQLNSMPVCFVCKEAVSKTGVEHRQRCQTAHCNKYYHLECLDHWPQTQFTSGEPSKSNKKINEHFEALMCPRHVCHTCVSDDPRGCKTRFSGDKLARCVRCPATYHTFTKCLPAGTKILTGSLIVCPRHYEHRPGKVPCHVNTGWCFICALGGSLICCEYCPTSFHAECLNIKPPEGGYMCEDCETGRLPLYGEMVWVKLGHYRWWPGIILHPSEIPENIMAVKHSPGEFVVRFFGQYDHYWVNRGRVFPFQEGDSGKISGQKTKIDAAFTTAMEHAQRACEILKTAEPNEEESIDIASSLLPPHYVKLKVNKPCGSLCGRRVDVEESSLTQCECDPAEDEPCGPYSHCLNRMLLTECGPGCRAGERCSNRAFERRRYPRLAPYRTPHRGWGLKALEDIKAGQFVIEYVGELIDEEEFRRRMNRKHEIRDENFYFLTLDKERMIDAGPKGNLARFMNHCCEPNCETQKWTVLGDVRVGLFALYDIPANSELTFNYNLECAGIEKKRCMCGAKRCSGYIGAKPKQEETQPKKNKLPAKRAYKKRKNVEDSPSTSKPKPKRPVGRPAKPRELTEIEKDLLIIKNATNGLSSDSEGSRLSSVDEKAPKALKRKRVSFSTEECKRQKVDEKSREVGD